MNNRAFNYIIYREYNTNAIHGIMNKKKSYCEHHFIFTAFYAFLTHPYLSAIEIIDVKDNKIVNLFDPLTLTCNSTGSRGTPDAIDWFFEGNLVTNRDSHWQGRVVITKRINEDHPFSLLSDLVIRRTTMEDQGRYICRSTTYTDPKTAMPTISVEVMILNSK